MLFRFACAVTLAVAAAAPARAETAAPAAVPAAPVAAPTPAKAPKKESIALIAVRRGEGFSEKQGSTVEELLLGALDQTGAFKVIGQSDIDAVISLEAKKESIGCDDTNCAVQIAGALGVDLVSTASIGKLGSTTLLSIKLIDVRTATVVVRAQQTVKSEDDLPAAAQTLANQIVAGRYKSSSPAVVLAAPSPYAPVPLPAAATAPSSPKPMSIGRTVGIVALVVGGVGLAVGTGLGVVAMGQTTALRATPPPPRPVQQSVASINTLVTGATIGWTAGGVIGAAGVGLVVVF